jgi:hypothetical protein
MGPQLWIYGAFFIGEETMEFLTAIALLAFAWLATLSGVLVGGHLVYKASGNAGDLFSTGKGGAYHIDDGLDAPEPDLSEQVPESLAKHMDRFRQSFDPGETIFGASGGYQRYGKHGAARPFEAPEPPKPEHGDMTDGQNATEAKSETGKV